MAYCGVATQLYVWSQVLQQQGLSLDQQLGPVLAEVAAAGYDGVESNLSFLEERATTEQLAESLDLHSLQLAGLYSGGDFHDRGKAPETVEHILIFAEESLALGCQSINVNPSSIGRDKTDDELVIQGEYLDQLGRGLKNLGLLLTCHNHTPEIRNNAREFRAICAYTTPGFVGMCVDVHWVLRGGEDPMRLMREYSDRVKALHVRNSADGVWSEDFGDGEINYSDVHRFLQEIGYDGWLTVELAYEQATEMTRSLAENAQLSCQYARQVFGLPDTSA